MYLRTKFQGPNIILTSFRQGDDDDDGDDDELFLWCG